MISEQELQAAIVSVEQNIKDCEKSKENDKHATDRLTKWSVLIAENKIKLQVLHYAMGLACCLSETELNKGVEELNILLKEMNRPQEVDLFKTEDGKELARTRRLIEIKQFTLRFVLGVEKKIV